MNKKPVSSNMQNKPSFFETVNRITMKWDRQVLLLLGVIVAILFFMAATGTKNFFTARSFSSMMFQMPEIGILSMGMMVTILIGGIDLSIISVANLTSILVGFFLLNVIPKGINPSGLVLYLILGVVLTFVIGLICGLINGYLIGFLGIPPILTTLGSSLLFIGLGLGITNGQTLFNFPEPIPTIGSKSIFGIPLPMIIFLVVGPPSFAIGWWIGRALHNG